MQNIEERWVEVDLKKITSCITKGSTPTTYGFQYLPKGIRFIKIENVRDGILELKSINQFISPDAHEYLKRSQLREDDMLFSIAGSIGKTCFIHKDDLPANTNQAFAIIRGYKDYIIPKFLRYQLDSTINRVAQVKARGGAMNNISLEDLARFSVLLPPLSEQRAIVAKLETLLSELDNAVTTLKQAKEQIKTYRQAVLKAAFTGKLTEEWGKQNTSVSLYDLTKSVCDLREYRADCPEIWALYSFTDVCSIDSNLVIPDEYLDYPHIAPDNIEKGSGKLIDYNSVRQDGVRSPKHKFFNGQIIYSKIRPYLSKATIAGFDGLCSADMYPLTSKINSKYLLFYILSTTFVELASTAGTRSLLPKINQKELSEIPVPVTSKEEQQQIVSEIESRFSTADKLEQIIDDSLSTTEALKQSLLKQALEGKLLTEQELEQTRQAPDWEPADKLLKRIKNNKY